MERIGHESNIFYFNQEGAQNTDSTIDLVLERQKMLNINKILVFTKDGDTALKLRKKNKDLNVIAVSFPSKQEIYIPDEDNGTKKVEPATSREEVQQILAKNNIQLVLGTMPFNEIVIPGIKETKKQIIYHTLSLISGGLNLCIQAVCMATDNGKVSPQEKVIAMSADTAIVATASNTYWLFHPTKGLEVNELICKPKHLSIVHSNKTRED